MSNERPRGPMGRHGRGMSGEKAKNFKGAMKRLFIYMERYRIQLFIMLLFAVGSTIFNIIGPKILGKATTELLTGSCQRSAKERELISERSPRSLSEPCACIWSAQYFPLSRDLSCQGSLTM